MTKAEEILEKHLKNNLDQRLYLRSSRLTYNLCLDALNEAINYTESREELICVDNVNYEFLTIGKKYNLSCETDNYYRIENDLGHVVDMSKVRFGKVTAN